MEVIKNRPILSITMCHKKRYIRDYFNRMKSDMYMKTNNDKPSLSKLCKIMNKATPKEEEWELRVLMLHFEYGKGSDSLVLIVIVYWLIPFYFTI